MKNFILNHIIVVFLFTSQISWGQEMVRVEGRITDPVGNPLELVNITIPGTTMGTVSDRYGYYVLNWPASDTLVIRFSIIGFESQAITRLGPFQRALVINLNLFPEVREIEEVQISGERDQETGFVRLKMKELKMLPTVSGSVESYLQTLPGVSSAGELSSQYSVRGGNYDENLIYINDIEVYKPFLIRAGQQEGLSIINPDLTESVQFSAGGFNASFGDKMSSALDIHYRTPTRIGGGFELSLLGGSVFFEGMTQASRFTWLAGARYKSNQYLLNTLDVQGDYKPRFTDVQTYLTYKVHNKWTLEFLGNLSINNYQFYPQDQRTSFGTIVDAVQLYILLDGQEKDRFNTYLGAVTASFNPNPRLSMKFIGHGYRTTEKETFDIEGYYALNELDKELGSENLGDSILNIGIGRFIDHARNSLDATVWGGTYTGAYKAGQSKIKWGMKAQNELIDDRINEWKMVDSAGFSIPYDGNTVNLAHQLYANNTLSTWRMMSYILYQNQFGIGQNMLSVDAGIRSQYWTFNNQWLVSPRISLTLSPDWEKEFRFRLASGFYYQPPFFKEMRTPEGAINEHIRAQRSIHFLMGGTYLFQAWNRPFQLSMDVYYKHLSSLISYKMDNVRILYSGYNDARGYATGIDIKINGEFVKGAESWFSLSLMQTRQQLTYLENAGAELTGVYYPRPTDQLINFGLFFQDYFPNNPTFRVYLTLLYGTGLPSSSPYTVSGEDYFRMPPYRRVDIGISKILKDENNIMGEKGLFKYFRTAWISLEVFNLLGVRNTISYTWLTTVNNLNGQVGQFAVPNYLTSRRLNLKLTATF